MTKFKKHSYHSLRANKKECFGCENSEKSELRERIEVILFVFENNESIIVY